MSKSQVIGIDFGGTSIKLAVVEGAELVSEEIRIPTQDYDEPEALMDRIAEVLAEVKLAWPRVAAIGIGVPGAVDFAAGMTYNLTNVKGWTTVPLRDLLAERTGMPCLVDNDANCMAYAEWRYGAAQGAENAVCLTLGTGVGGGLILNHQLFRGSRFAAGEIGQMSVDIHGVEGPYGNSGALERYIGNRQIGELGERLFTEAGASFDGELTPAILAQLAEQGHPVALEVWNRVADYLGGALASIVYLLNPEIIVIGGGVAEAGDLLFQPLQRKLEATLTAECLDHLQVVTAAFGNTAGIIGSAVMAADVLCGGECGI